MGCSKGGRGQTLIELMLVLPVFLLLVFGIMDLGVMAFYTVMLNHAAFETARIVSISGLDNDGTGNPCDMTDAARVISQVLRNATAVCSVENTTQDSQVSGGGGGLQDQDVVIHAKYPVQFLFPLSAQALGAACPRASKAGPTSCYTYSTVRMPVEQPRPFSAN